MQKKSKIWIHILVIFLILILFSGGVYYYFNKEKNTIENIKNIENLYNNQSNSSEKNLHPTCANLDTAESEELINYWTEFKGDYFSFKYPKDWILDADIKDLVTVKGKESNKEVEFAVRTNEMSNMGLEGLDLFESKSSEVGCVASEQTSLKGDNQLIAIIESFNHKNIKYLLTFNYYNINQDYSEGMIHTLNLILKTFEFK